MQKIIDITPVVSPDLAVWPGDVPFSRSVALDIASGANITLSSITATVHLGAHTDAPSHYAAGGQTIEQRPLDYYVGPCEVIWVGVGRGERVRPEHLPGPVRAPRVLIRTGSYPDPRRFNEDFAALSPDLVEHLADQGVRLVGIDTPSIDLCHDKALQTHLAVARRDLAILEGIVLDAVPAGLYTLVALPLPLLGADASPVRAVLLA